MTDFLLAAFARYGEAPAVVWKDQRFSYAWLGREILGLEAELRQNADTRPGTIVALLADYSPRSLALLIALLRIGNVVAPLTRAFDAQKPELFDVAEVQTEIHVDDRDQFRIEASGRRVEHPLLVDLSASGAGGLVLFSSGSTGKMKAAVHHGARLLGKYRTPRRAKVTIPFMLFDHIGGINTVLHALSSGGTAVVAEDRSPQAICGLIARHKVEVLPTTPTFLNLLLLGDYRGHDLSSLEILAYGAERMPPATLARLREAFPNVALVQNYGLSEVGIMRTKSEASDSLWMKISGEDVQTRVRDGLLEIKAPTAMVGYLNEVSPFTDDGWLRTDDRVEVKGEFLRVLGRQSEIIIVGGEKVYPAEVEDLIAMMPNVLDVVVSGEANAIAGQIVKAEVQLISPEPRADFKAKMATFLAGRLLPFKIPQRVVVTMDPIVGARLKKRRR